MMMDKGPKFGNIRNHTFDLKVKVMNLELLCGEGVLYLTSPGHPTDIGLQLGKACYPCSR